MVVVKIRSNRQQSYHNLKEKLTLARNGSRCASQNSRCPWLSSGYPNADHLTEDTAQRCPFGSHLGDKMGPYVEVLSIGRAPVSFATSIALLLSSYTGVRIDPGLSIRNASIPLQYRTPSIPSALRTYSICVVVVVVLLLLLLVLVIVIVLVVLVMRRASETSLFIQGKKDSS